MEYTTRTIIRGNITVNIHRPILTEKERAKQENIILETLKHLCIQEETL